MAARDIAVLNIAQIEQNIANVFHNLSTGDIHKDDFIYELLLGYGHLKQSVSRLKSGERNIASKDNKSKHDEVIWKRHLHFKVVDGTSLHSEIDAIRKGKITNNYRIRFVIVTNFDEFLAVDTKTTETLDIKFSDLPKQFDFFLPWAGMEKAVYQGENPADVKAAEKMAKLFDLIKADNFDDSDSDNLEALHNLNVFLTRLLFCYFAEDTGIFSDNQFSSVIQSHTKEDGSDVAEYLDRLFGVLNTPKSQRKNLPDFLDAFEYVNGGLFSDSISAPKFSRKSRRILIECGSELDWSGINPDIFGSMIQAVVHPDQRGGMGMHYTSVTNIMKVIEPLFLNDLYKELEKAENSPTKLQRLQQRLGEIKIFDPACGSGNFLIIAYKELRKLEMEVIKRLQELESEKSGQVSQAFTVIKLSQFYGIELDDFAHEVAILSLWLTEHQMNVEFKAEFGEAIPSLPLNRSAEIFHGNALTKNWQDVCDFDDLKETYVIGNPPYLGAKNQSEQQKVDMRINLNGITIAKNLDYISCWFITAARYINANSKFAFVSTNSLCQGTQVPLVWPHVLNTNVEIFFAYKDFKWTNNAAKNAGVTCSIIGLRHKSKKPKFLFNGEVRKTVANINPYLIDGPDLYVEKASKSICNLPKIQNGNQPYDGGHLIFTETEKESFVSNYPESSQFFKRIIGSSEFIKGSHRWCLWIENEDLELAKSIDPIKIIIDKVNHSRINGGECARSCADRPHQFRWVNRAKESQIVVPLVSSERREYIPMGFVDKETIVNNLAQVMFDPDPYIFSLINSKIHMVWVHAIAGRMRTDIRYSAGVCYNTFPVPSLSDQDKELLRKMTAKIISVRERYSDSSFATLYDPKKMPDDLKAIHAENDQLVDSIYRKSGFRDDSERLTMLFSLYQELVGGNNA